MKNRKIIALLCAMAMIVTTLSSIFVVNAAAAPQMVVNIGDKDENGQYEVTVGYEGYEDMKVTAVTLKLPIPEGTTYVADSFVNLDEDNFTASYSSKNNRINIEAAALKGVFNKGTGDICKFKVTLNEGVTSTIDFAFSNGGSITDETSGSAVEYAVGSAENPLKVAAGSIEYKRDWNAGEPSFTIAKKYNEDGTVTLTVKYDFTKVTGTAPVFSALTLKLPIADGAEYVADSFVNANEDAFTASYSSKNNRVNVEAASLKGFVSEPTGEIFSINVKVADKATFAFSQIDLTITDGDQETTLKLSEDKVYAPSVKVTATPEPEPVDPSTPSPEPVDPSTPSPEPVDPSTPSPSVKAPVKAEVTSNVKTPVGNGYKVNLSLTGAEGVAVPAYVDVVIQGWSKANAKGTTTGSVVFSHIDTTKLDSIEDIIGVLPDAKSVSITVYDNDNMKNVVSNRVVGSK